MLELQSTLEELSSRVDGVKEENLRLRSENQVLGQYIENLMTASKVIKVHCALSGYYHTNCNTVVLLSGFPRDRGATFQMTFVYCFSKLDCSLKSFGH